MSFLPYQFEALEARLRAQTEATQALVDEQRTANLIAALQPVRLLENKEWLPSQETVARVRAEIDARLYPKESR